MTYSGCLLLLGKYFLHYKTSHGDMFYAKTEIQKGERTIDKEDGEWQFIFDKIISKFGYKTVEELNEQSKERKIYTEVFNKLKEKLFPCESDSNKKINPDELVFKWICDLIQDCDKCLFGKNDCCFVGKNINIKKAFSLLAEYLEDIPKI